MNVVVMENFLQDKDLWIVGSVCLVASILWRRFWNLFTYKRKRDSSPESASIDIQVQTYEYIQIGLFLSKIDITNLICANPHDCMYMKFDCIYM